MEPREKIEQAKANHGAREAFIKENIPFIRGCASRVTGHFVDESDDAFSEAMTAFYDALISYDESKGRFHAFAGVCIQNRLRDYLRAQNRHSRVIPFSSLAPENDSVSLDVEDSAAGISEMAIEICSLKAELEPFGISFFELPKAAPKAKKTRRACVEIARYIAGDRELLSYVYNKKALPVKQILSRLPVNKKITERHRKYLIMGVLIINGNYEILSGYFDPDNGR